MAEENGKQRKKVVEEAIAVTEKFEKTDKGLMKDYELYGDPSAVPESKEKRVF